MKIGSLEARIAELEDSQGFETLDDGSRAKMPSGLRIGFHAMHLRRESGRPPVLQDFPPEMQTDIRNFARWHPDPGKNGQLSVITADLCRQILARSDLS